MDIVKNNLGSQTNDESSIKSQIKKIIVVK